MINVGASVPLVRSSLWHCRTIDASRTVSDREPY